MSFKIPKEITPQQVAERLKNGEAPTLLDVREPAEWVEGHVIGAKHIPLGQLLMRIDELDPNGETIVMCLSGGRSGLACELLSEKGYNVVNMMGGLSAWTDDFWYGGNSMNMMFRILLSILIVFSIVRFLRSAWPVRSLAYVEARDVRELADQTLDMKMLDVRDAVDYEKDNIRGSINISIGRLAYVWQHCLSPDDSVLILADSYYKRNKAARILYKQGFRKLYAVNGDF